MWSCKDILINCIAIYIAPDLIPQGKIDQRFSLDLGMKKAIQKGKSELFKLLNLLHQFPVLLPTLLLCSKLLVLLHRHFN
jgi:hypothetical protein